MSPMKTPQGPGPENRSAEPVGPEPVGTESAEAGFVDFGFASVPPAEKRRRVDDVFARVAPYYDRMNDAMSLGAHRLWKRAAAMIVNARPGMRVLDLAAGSGDLAARIAPDLRPAGQIVLADASAAMLAVAAEKFRAERFRSPPPPPSVFPVRCDAENLPFAAARFDKVVIGFGLRNIADRPRALAEMRRVLRVGGGVFVLEFSPPQGESVSAKARRAYLQKVLPKIGQAVAGDAESYRYLAESILRFPAPEALGEMMREAGFARVDWLSFAAGTVCLHRGRRESFS